MQNFEDKATYEIHDIISLIENEVEESIHLEFKEANALEKIDNKKKEISKDVSAFANSDGGLIIYGIKEVNHKAHSISYIDGNLYTKEWLEQTINSNIQRRVSDLAIYPIRNRGNISETIYVIKIPKSYDTPHICKDKRFYKRFNFESVAMEEYEIRELYERKTKSKLIISDWIISKAPSDEHAISKFIFEASILNEGNVFEDNYKANVYFSNLNEFISFSWPQNQLNYDYTRLEKGRIKISSKGHIPIYPGESLSAIRFDLKIYDDKLDEVLKSVKVEIMLLYSNGEEKWVLNLEEQITKLLI